MTSFEHPSTILSVEGPNLLINGRKTTLLGFRVPSAALRDDWTDELISQFGLWREHGVNAFTIWLQGSSGGYVRLFDDRGEVEAGEMEVLAHVDFMIRTIDASVGTTTGPQVLARARRIIEAADAHGMVVILGLYYRSATTAGKFTPDALRRAAGIVAAEFAGCTNVIFDVFNEAMTGRPLESYEDLTSYMRAVKQAAPDRPVGTGSVNSEISAGLAAAPELDIVLHDAGAGGREAVAALEMLRAFAGKPIANIESFQGSGNSFIDDSAGAPDAPEGYYIDFPGYRRVFGAFRDEDYWTANGKYTAGRNSYLKLIDYVCADPARQTHLLVHAAGWFQGASRVIEVGQLGTPGTPGRWGNNFRAGYGRADGTTANPGIQWILDHFRRKRAEAEASSQSAAE